MTTDFTAIPFALSYIVVVGSQLVSAYVALCGSLESVKVGLTCKEMWELKGRFKLLKLQAKRFYRISNFYNVCIVARCAVTLLEVLALVAVGTTFGGMQESVFTFTLSNLLCLLFLAHAGNRFETEVRYFLQ